MLRKWLHHKTADTLAWLCGIYLVRPFAYPWSRLWGWFEARTFRRFRHCKAVETIVFNGEICPEIAGSLARSSRKASPKTCVVLVHGFTLTRAQMGRPARRFLKEGVDCVMIDLPHHGETHGVCTFGVNEAKETALIVELLKQKYGYERVFLFGMSMGAATVLQSLRYEPEVDAVISLASFATMPSVIEDYTNLVTGSPRPRLAKSILEYVRELADYDPAESAPLEVLRHLRQPEPPILFIHGQADSNIPPRHSRELHDAYSGPKELLWVPRAGHYTLLSPRHRHKWSGPMIRFLRRRHLLPHRVAKPRHGRMVQTPAPR